MMKKPSLDWRCRRPTHSEKMNVMFRKAGFMQVVMQKPQMLWKRKEFGWMDLSLVEHRLPLGSIYFLNDVADKEELR